MRFESLKLRGIGPYKDEVSVDLTALPGVLTAVVGPNGAGKSVLLGALLGGIYRDVPGRGSLMDLATERGAFVEVGAVNGKRWTLRQIVDPVSKKSEALILDEDGRPVIDDGKVRSADAWVRAHLPPIEVLLSSVFAAQGSEGFLSMKPAERKAVLLRVLGVERLEKLAARAREQAKEARQSLAVLEARIGDERQRGGDVGALRAQHTAALKQVEQAADRLTAAREALHRAREELALDEQRRALTTRLTALRERERALTVTLERADEIRAAAAERGELEKALAKAEADARSEAEAAKRIRATLEQEREAFNRAKRAAEEAERRASRAREQLADRERIEEAVAALPKLREKAKAADEALAAARGELEQLQSQRVAGAEERVGALRGALVAICEGHANPPEAAESALSADDAAVELARELPGLIAKARAAVREREQQAADAARVARGMELLANRAPELERAAEELEAAEYARAEARTEMHLVRTRGVELLEEAKGHEAMRDEHEASAATMRERAAKLERLASQIERLTEAEVLRAEVQAQAQAVSSELDALPATSPSITAEVAERERQVEAEEFALRGAERDAATAEHAAQQAEAAAGRIAVLESEHKSVERDLADWNRLARDLGRDGVQAALIDAAGPELTELVNDLLHSCVGTRWSVSIETTRLSADGKRQLEGLDVRVIDTERGRDALVETYSGGERVLLGEAVSLALTMLACRRSGLEGVTLVRDESGAALDPERSHAYVAMLRRAADLVGASRVLLVSHSPEVAEMCDSRLVVRDGQVEVQS